MSSTAIYKCSECETRHDGSIAYYSNATVGYCENCKKQVALKFICILPAVCQSQMLYCDGERNQPNDR